MFIGEYFHTLDDKGRISLPAKFRDRLKEGFVIAKGLEVCLFVYPLKEWEKVGEKVQSLSWTKRENRIFSRSFFSGAAKDKLDKQGRVFIPANLREFAQLKKEVAIVGISNRIEIWDKPKWQIHIKEAESIYPKLADELDMGI